MPKRRIVGAFIAAIVTVAGVSQASAAVWATGSGGVVDVCFTSSDLTGVAATEAAASAAAWNVTSSLHVTYGTCDAGANKVAIALGTLPAGGELGLTQWTETAAGQFVAVNITFDPAGIKQWISDLSTSGLETTTKANVDAWRTVTCHEMGHALGLEHTTEADSCMQTNVTTPNPHPGAIDISTLIGLYGGSATTSTSTSTSTTMDTTSTTMLPTTTPTTLPDSTTTTVPATSTTSVTTPVPITSTTVASSKTAKAGGKKVLTCGTSTPTVESWISHLRRHRVRHLLQTSNRNARFNYGSSAIRSR